MNSRVSFLLTALLVVASSLAAQPATAPSEDASALADQVMKASGADAWPKVTRIKFTFAGRRQQAATWPYLHRRAHESDEARPVHIGAAHR